MKVGMYVAWSAAAALGLAASVHAGDTPIGDFRIGSVTYPSNTAFDPGFTENTRSVIGAPVQVNSVFTGGSQNATGAAPDTATDVVLRTFTASTQIRNLSRFNPSTDGGTSGPSRVGMVQWKFDLTPLDSYLTDNSLALTALDLDLITSVSDSTKKYDVYLSYTNPAESITLADIDNSTVGIDPDGNDSAGGLNWQNFFNPAQGATAGDVINGTHRALVLEHTNFLVLNDDLLGLYNAGVREFNLQLAAGDFWSSRNINIQDGSGLSITTEAAGGVPGDADGDGDVDLDDFNILAANFGQLVASGPTVGDFDNDMDTDLDDFNILAANFGTGVPEAVASLPEPTTAMLLAGMGAVVLRRRR